MKKSIVFIVLSALLVTSCGCSNISKKYPYDHVGFYDTKTHQYIDINSDKSSIDKILGDGLEHNKGSVLYSVDYDDDLTIRYNDDNKSEYIHLYVSMFDDSPTRYELPNQINGQSTVTDFIESFQYVYELNKDSDLWNTVATYVEERNGKFVYLSKEDLCKRAEKQNNAWTEIVNNNPNSSKREDDFKEYVNQQDPIYEISLDYSSYDDIEFLEISKIDYPMFENWDTDLSEIE